MRTRRSAGLLALFLLSVALPGWLACGSEDERAEKARSQAQAGLARRDIRATREALAQLRERGPDTPEALLELTALMVQAGEAPHALWLLEAGSRRFAERDDIQARLAEVALLVSNPVLAREASLRIKRGSSYHLLSLLARAQAELQLGDVDAGLAILEQAQRMHPDDPRASAARIAGLVREQRFDAASKVIAQATASAPTRATARGLQLLAARVEIAQGDVDAAIRRLETLVDADPEDAVALQTLVGLLLQADRAADAMIRVEVSDRRNPNQTALPAIRAQIYLARGQFEDAERDIRLFVERSNSPSAYVLLSEFYRQRGELERAVEAFISATESHPDSPMLRMHLTESLIEVGRLGEAKVEFEAFDRLSADDPRGDYLRARLLLADGDTAEAAALFTTVVSDLDRSYTQYWLGRALEATGDAEGAGRRYGLASARDPNDTAPLKASMRLAERRGKWSDVASYAAALLRQGAFSDADLYATAVTALTRTNELERAETLAREFQERFPERPEPAAVLALTLRAQRRVNESKSVLDKARIAFGPHPTLDAERAVLLATAGQIPAGIALLQSVAEREPDSPHHHAALAALFYAKDDARAGHAEVERALELEPLNPAPLLLRARYLTGKRQLLEARADLERYLEVRPDDSAAFFTVGLILVNEGKIDEAIEAYGRARILDKTAYAPRNNLALLLLEQGKTRNALKIANEAYAIADDNPYVIDTLGQIYLEGGRPDRAAKLFEMALAIAPETAEIRFHMAIAYAKTGRPDTARRHLKEVLRNVDGGSDLAAEAHAALQTLPD